MKSPFKFLDAYRADDRDAFFGRETEAAALYDMVTKNRLILIYGQSGTGKTSLIQCGLASRFDATDWFPIFIRRQNDLPRSLEFLIKKAANSSAETPLAEALDDIYCEFLRPIYLIFDQLEELFIFGNEAEQSRFLAAVRSILDANVPCRLLFVIREDYLVYLYDFEREIPNLFDRRLRVEPMNTTKIEAVLKGSFQRFQISLEAPADLALQKMMAQVSGGRGVQLPFLQVYLDLFYREDFARTYPDRPSGFDAERGEWLPIEFSQKEIESFGGIEQTLEKFLREQKMALQTELAAHFPETPADAVAKILDAFVSEEGTKRPIGFEWKPDGSGLQVETRWKTLFQPLSDVVLGHCCRQLEAARLLRFSDEHMELAHDALASLIDGQRSLEQRRLQETWSRLLYNFKDFEATGEFLSRKQLNSLEEVWPVLEKRLDASVIDFVKNSRSRVEKLERAELDAEKKKQRQARRMAFAGWAVAAAAVVALFQYNRTVQTKHELAQSVVKMQLVNALKFKTEGNYASAIQTFKLAQPYFYELTENDQSTWRKETDNWPKIYDLVAAGDSLKTAEHLRTALEMYDSAYQISPDPRLQTLRERTSDDLERLFTKCTLSGYARMNAKQWQLALESFEKAVELKPSDENVAKKVVECKRLLGQKGQ